MALTLTSLPEEILERILALALAPGKPSSDKQQPAVKSSVSRSQSAPFPTSTNSLTPFARVADFRSLTRDPVFRYSPLLVSSLFARIGTALLYSAVHLKSPEQCRQLLSTLRQRPGLASCIRTLRMDGIWGDSKKLVKALRVPGARLESFDFCITEPEYGYPGNVPVLELFCEALSMLPTLRTVKELTVRKAADAYLALPAPNCVLERLSVIIPQCNSLQTVNIAFRLPSGPRPSLLAPAQTAEPTAMSGVNLFIAALAHAPSLRVVHAELPAVWNTALLQISANPSLAAIRLSPAPPVAGAHMFLAEARKHARLAELIESGTPQPVFSAREGRRVSVGGAPQPRGTSAHGRVRAHTTVAVSSAGSASSSRYGGAPSAYAAQSGSSRPPSSYASASKQASGSGFLAPEGRASQRPPVTSYRSSKGNRRMSAV